MALETGTMDMTTHQTIPPAWAALALVLLALCALPVRAADDPFADLNLAPLSLAAPPETVQGWLDNLLVRREIYLLGGGFREPGTEGERGGFSRLSLGFELQKRFASPTRTLASVNYQGRLVYRDRVPDMAADHMGREADRWKYETHNAYADFYNLIGAPGRLNLRTGYFYQPFGLNQQTDTHGTILQLLNDTVFGAERDWQATIYGNLDEHFDYTFGYLAGSGPEHELKGQAGLVVARLALDNQWLFEHGLEGGISFAAGERVDRHAVMRSHSVHHATGGGPVVGGWRLGADLRRRFDTAGGPLTLTVETAAGEDENDALYAALGQADWLHPGRRWGAALQYRHFQQDVGAGGRDYNETGASAVITHYFQNDVGNAALHWLALAVERRLRHTGEPEQTVLILQYYRYW